MKVAVIGLARSGYAAARLAHRLGYAVRVTDACAGAHESAESRRALEQHAAELRSLGIPVELGIHTPACIKDATLVVTSPGVPESALPLVWARERHVPVVSEIEFAVRHTNARIAAITGTNGKTTTTALTGHILAAAGVPAIVAGNIGQALSSVVGQATAQHILALEISSFQLETVQSFHPSVAVWLNLTPDHLDRYPSMEAYAAAKGRVFMNMTHEDWAIVWNADRALVAPFLETPRPQRVWIDETGRWSPSLNEPYGAVCVNGEFVTIFNGIRHSHGTLAETKLVGDHNAVNILAACATARILHVPEHVITTAIRSFTGLPHRLELVAKLNGISFVNDSKATNVDAMVKALETIPAPIALIAGGYDKGGDFAPVAPLVKDKTCRVVLMGAAKEKLAAAFKRVAEPVLVETMADAVAAAARRAPKGTTVLLAPGCASYDLYTNFEERGADFRNAVNALTRTMT